MGLKLVDTRYVSTGLSSPSYLLLSCYADGTHGSLTYRCLLATLKSQASDVSTYPQGTTHLMIWGGAMKLVHICYAALGYAVARWIFKRQPVPVADPVTRFRSSGLL